MENNVRLVEITALYRDGGSIDCRCIYSGELFTCPMQLGKNRDERPWFKGTIHTIGEQITDDTVFVPFRHKDVVVDKKTFDKVYTLPENFNNVHDVPPFLEFCELVKQDPSRYEFCYDDHYADKYIYMNQKVFSREDLKELLRDLNLKMAKFEQDFIEAKMKMGK